MRLLHPSEAQSLPDSALRELLPASFADSPLTSLMSALATYVLQCNRDAVYFFIMSIRSGISYCT
jgi:hypothetical protein